jgi:hypothetical protein
MYFSTSTITSILVIGFVSTTVSNFFAAAFASTPLAKGFSITSTADPRRCESRTRSSRLLFILMVLKIECSLSVTMQDGIPNRRAVNRWESINKTVACFQLDGVHWGTDSHKLPIQMYFDYAAQQVTIFLINK